jgi:RNA polymerase sigma factor (sigma-70 family)
MNVCLGHFSASISTQSSRFQKSRSCQALSSPGAITQGHLQSFWPLWLSHQAYLYRKFTQYANQIRQWRSWLTKLCHRTCLDFQRSVCPSLNLEELDNELGTPDCLSPYQYAIALETEETIDQAMQKLPFLLRQAFILRCIEELSYSEIAQRLEITEANARKRVEQARAKLRKSLKSEFDEGM